VRLYGLDYKNRLEEAGFTVIAEDYTKDFSDELVERYRLPKGEMIYLCKK
jgi:uncharacterized protein YwqG